MRNFVVAAWERSRHRTRALHEVEADTAEHAIEQVASDLPEDEQAGNDEYPEQNLLNGRVHLEETSLSLGRGPVIYPEN